MNENGAEKTIPPTGINDKTIKMEYQNSLRRAISHLVDLVLIVAIVTLATTLTGNSENTKSLVNITLTIIFLIYMTLAEGIYGQSLGKKLFGIKVVMENGNKCTLKAALIRNLLRVVDAIPSIYLVGILVITFTAKRQRIGDLAAKTVVVKR